MYFLSTKGKLPNNATEYVEKRKLHYSGSNCTLILQLHGFAILFRMVFGWFFETEENKIKLLSEKSDYAIDYGFRL